MDTTTVAKFDIIGIAIRTTNENGQSATDIPKLWNKFFAENIIAQIPNKVDDTIYCIYTDYEKDHTRPYTTILGCKVKALNVIPNDFEGRSIGGGNFIIATVKGKITDGVVLQEWKRIWNTDIPRAYTADFEVYGVKAQTPDNAVIDIFIAVKD